MSNYHIQSYMFAAYRLFFFLVGSLDILLFSRFQTPFTRFSLLIHFPQYYSKLGRVPQRRFSHVGCHSCRRTSVNQWMGEAMIHWKDNKSLSFKHSEIAVLSLYELNAVRDGGQT